MDPAGSIASNGETSGRRGNERDSAGAGRFSLTGAEWVYGGSAVTERSQQGTCTEDAFTVCVLFLVFS